MSDEMTIVLSCPKCEAELEVTSTNLADMACLECGSQQLMQLYGTAGWQEATAPNPEDIYAKEITVEEIERLQEAKRRRAAAIARQKLHEEIRHAQNEVASWQQTPLDEISPPRLTERVLPMLAGATLMLGFFTIRRRANPGIDAVLAGSLLLGLYAFLRNQRRSQAQQRVHNVVGRWLTDLEERQQRWTRRDF